MFSCRKPLWFHVSRPQTHGLACMVYISLYVFSVHEVKLQCYQTHWCGHKAKTTRTTIKYKNLQEVQQVSSSSSLSQQAWRFSHWSWVSCCLGLVVAVFLMHWYWEWCWGRWLACVFFAMGLVKTRVVYTPNYSPPSNTDKASWKGFTMSDLRVLLK